METGLVVGKFIPLHLGHLGLINFAKENSDKVVIIMCLEDKYNYPKGYIENLVRGLEKDKKVKVKIMPQQDSLNYEYDNTDEVVSKEWAECIKGKLAKKNIVIDKVFSSESYGKNFSKHLGAKNCIYDIDRTTVNVSGTSLRKNLVENWELLSEISKKSFQKHVVVTGVEGTGKTTFIKCIMKHLSTKAVSVPEYGASFCITNGYPETKEDFQRIREVQIYTEDLLKAQNTPYVISDTDWRTTDSYESFYCGYKDSYLHRNPDLYILLDNIKDNYSTNENRLPKTERLVLRDILLRKILDSNSPVKTPEEFIESLSSREFWNFYNNTVTKEAIVQPGNED